MKFGFKQSNSAVLCSLMYKEVVSNIYRMAAMFIHVFWMHQRHLISFILDNYSLF